MKSLFLAVRKGDLEKVKQLVNNNKSIVNSIAKQPPKKDDGQSPLQVAYKTGNFDIANYLIDMGADINYIEKKSINEWRAPVIHDAIRATIFSTRYPVSFGEQNSKKQFENAFNSLKKIIKAGANMKAQDSFGNNCAMRAVLDARQFNYDEKKKYLIEDLKVIFKLLKQFGVDFNEATNTRESALEFIKDEPIAKLIK